MAIDIMEIFKLFRKLVSVSLLFLLHQSCGTYKTQGFSGVGFGDVFREIVFEKGIPRSKRLVSGEFSCLLEGRPFEILLKGQGRLGPENFRLERVEGLGTAFVKEKFIGKGIPLELEIHMKARVRGPFFHKEIRLRWVGPRGNMPFLEKITIENVLWKGRAWGGGKGRPVFTESLFLGSPSPWVETSMKGRRIIMEERPGIYLGPGWWHSARAVLGPCGKARPERAFLRWIGSLGRIKKLILLAESADRRGGIPSEIAGFRVFPLGRIDYGRPALSSPAGLAPRKRKKKGISRAVMVDFGTGIRADDPDFRKALQGGLGEFEKGDLVILKGIFSSSNAKSLAEGIVLLDALVKGPGIVVGWKRNASISPFWQALIDSQAGPDPSRDGPLLGKSLASLDPWRRKGEELDETLKDRLALSLGRGMNVVNLGAIPGKGTRGYEFLREMLDWRRKTRMSSGMYISPRNSARRGATYGLDSERVGSFFSRRKARCLENCRPCSREEGLSIPGKARFPL